MRTRRDRMALFGMGMLILAVLAAGYMQLYRLHDRLLLQEVMRMYTRIKENVNETDTAGMISIGGIGAGSIEAASAGLIQVNHFSLTLSHIVNRNTFIPVSRTLWYSPDTAVTHNCKKYMEDI
jgi:hypothetical protein